MGGSLRVIALVLLRCLLGAKAAALHGLQCCTIRTCRQHSFGVDISPAELCCSLRLLRLPLPGARSLVLHATHWTALPSWPSSCMSCSASLLMLVQVMCLCEEGPAHLHCMPLAGSCTSQLPLSTHLLMLQFLRIELCPPALCATCYPADRLLP